MKKYQKGSVGIIIGIVVALLLIVIGLKFGYAYLGRSYDLPTAKNQAIKATLPNLQLIAEDYYKIHNNYTDFCNLPETKPFQDKIYTLNPESSYICKDDLNGGQSYAIQVTLTRPRAQYSIRKAAVYTWCVDATGGKDGQIGATGCTP